MEAKGGNEAPTAEAEGGSAEAPTVEEKSNEADGGCIGAPTAGEGSNKWTKAVADAAA